jgi:Tim17/Tim22/Tim23/Pmp24 family
VTDASLAGRAPTQDRNANTPSFGSCLPSREGATPSGDDGRRPRERAADQEIPGLHVRRDGILPRKNGPRWCLRYVLFSHFRTSPTVFVFKPSSGFAAGGFFSLMSSSFAYEDPLLRQNLNTTQKSMEIFKDMGRGMWRSGKGFGKVGALYAGIECVIESVRTYSTRFWPCP